MHPFTFTPESPMETCSTYSFVSPQSTNRHRKRLSLFKSLAAAFCFSSLFTNVNAQQMAAKVHNAPAPQITGQFVKSRLLIKFGQGISPVYSASQGTASFNVPAVDALNAKYHCATARMLNAGAKSRNPAPIYMLQFAADVDVQQAVKEYQSTGVLAYAEPDYITGDFTTTIPNDADFSLQWSLNNNGTFPYASYAPVSGADIKMEQAWSITTGSSAVTVAVIDGGARLTHPEFSGRIWTNSAEIPGNGIDDDGDGYVDDVQGWNFVYGNNDPTDDGGHGTNVTGIIGANGNNSIGYAGIDWHCKLMILKTQDSSGSGTYDGIIEAIYYAADHGANVINMSLGGSSSSSAVQDAIDYAYADNVTLVAAMGNDNSSTPFYPAACNHIIAVGATTVKDWRAPYSNYGSDISVVAPGDFILGLSYQSNTDYSWAYSGTSQATPHVSGLVALLLAQNSTRTPDQIKTIIESTADDQVGNPAEDVVGYDYYYGHGRINAYRALTYCVPPAAITGTATTCLGTTTTLSDATTGGTWSSSATGVATIGVTTGIVSGIAAGTSTITYTNASGCYVTKVVTVNSVLSTSITGTLSICDGTSSTLADATTGGTWSSSNLGVAVVGASNGIATGLTAGTATITYRLNSGCATTATVTINPLPSSGTITGASSVIAGSTTTFSDATTGGIWSSANTTIATVNASGVVTGVGAGYVLISYSVTNGCGTVAATKGIAVTSAIAPITGTWSVCAGSTTTLSDTASGGTWSSSNTSVATVAAGIVTGVAAGTALISYTTSGGSAIAVVTVNSTPVAGIISGSSAICAGSTAALTESVTGGSWYSSSTAIAGVGGTGVVTGVAAGSATISYTVSNSCGSAVATKNIIVNAAPLPVSGTLAVCTGSTSTLTDGVTGGSWASSNSAIAAIDAVSGVVTGGTVGTATITYTLSSGCIATAVATINSTPATGVISGGASICVGSTTALTESVTGGVWSSSNTDIANVGSTGIVTGVSAGSAIISYTVSGSCGSAVATKNITVNTTPLPIGGALAICAGSTSALTESVSGGSWTSSNSAIAIVDASSGVVTGVSAGTSTITYAFSAGCITTAIVTVNNAPAAITGTGVACQGATTILADATTGGTWSSSDATVASVSTGVVSGVSAGTATISYTSGVGCYATKVVTINAQPSSIITSGGVCIGTTTTLGDAVSGGTWNSSSATVSVDASSGAVTGLSAGTALISYTIGTGCRTTAIVTVTSLPALITGTTNVCPGLTTTLADATTGGVWSTSDATVLLSSNVVTGVTSGTATITYSTGAGCSRTTVVTVNVAPSVIAGTPNLCVGATTTLSDAVTPGIGWTSSTITVATVGVGTGIVTGIAAGTSTITYKAASGCFVTQVVTVSSLPPAITGTMKVCVGATTSLSDASGVGAWSSSNTTAATVDPSSGVVSGLAAGITTITYSLGAGCTKTASVTVTAMPGAITGTRIACIGTTTTLADPNLGGTWSSAATGVATINVSNGIATGITAGTVNISYTLSGCSNTAVVTVNTIPTASTGAMTVCIGNTTTLTNALPGGTWSSQNYAIANVGSGTGIVTGVAAGAVSISYSFGSTCKIGNVITVSAVPAAITGTATVCTGATVTLADATSGGTWSSSATGIATIGTATRIVTGISAGTATISYALSTGCAKTLVVTVNATPDAGSISGPSTIHIAVLPTITLTDVVAGGVWSSSNTSVATVDGAGDVTGVAAGNATISYTVTNAGCTARATQLVSVSASRASGTGNTIEGGSTTLAIYPNPNKGVFTIKGALSSTDDAEVTLEVADMLGHVVYRNKVIAQNGQINEYMSLGNNLTSGVYILNVHANGENKAFHFVIE